MIRECLKCGQPIEEDKKFAKYCHICRSMMRQYGIVAKSFSERRYRKVDEDFKKEFDVKPHKTYKEILEERSYSDPNYRNYRKFIRGKKDILDFYSI